MPHRPEPLRLRSASDLVQPVATIGHLKQLAVNAVLPAGHGVPRVISDFHFAVQLNHFIPGFILYPVAVFLKRKSDIFLGVPPAVLRRDGGIVQRVGEERRARLRAHLLLKAEVLQLVGGGALAQKAVKQKRTWLVQIVGKVQAFR